jgi:four helix bundle protein
MKCYRDLQAWSLAIELVSEVYRICRSFPSSEKFGLSSQMQRAAVSVPANIAEGHARDSTKEFLHHLSIALGSLAEVETHAFVAEKLGYVRDMDLREILLRTDRIGKMIRGLQKSLRAKIAGQQKPH